MDGVLDLFVAKGKRVIHVDLVKARPSDDELLGVVIVVIWGVHDEAQLGYLSAVLLVVLKVIYDPPDEK